ncbi:MAG: HD domain-containing protein, partial [Acidimicrobiales bacterium]|nr:HD domain-containing protein [Acidimicrobiales bacterium]
MAEEVVDRAGPGDPELAERLRRQVSFVLELDRAKQVMRRNRLADGSRCENDAEHMWHLALAALVLAEHAGSPVDVGRVVLLCLVHDVVEIDAGDTFLYDEAAKADKAEREQRAADRLFGLLPSDQGRVLRDLWTEFDAGETAEARLAASVDRLLPLMLNRASGGATWAEHGVTASQVEAANEPLAAGAPALWVLARGI